MLYLQGYSAADEATKMRLSENTVLVDVMSQQFHSFCDVLRSAVRQLACPVIYEFLSAGYRIPHGGDHPKQSMLRALCKQEPEHLAKLIVAACENTNLLDKAYQANGIDPAAANGPFLLATAIRNFVPFLGPLHIHLNHAEDLGKTYRKILLAPIYCAIRGKASCPDKLHLQETMALHGIEFAAWNLLKETLPQLLPHLQKHMDRLDIATLVYYLEQEVPLSVFQYHGIFKSGTFHNLYMGGEVSHILHAILTKRRNYRTALPLKLMQELRLQARGHPLATLSMYYMHVT
jgi:hypothetical protein